MIRKQPESPVLPSPSCILPRMTGEEEDETGEEEERTGEKAEERYLSFVTVWKDLEITCQRPSALSRVR